MIVGCCVHNVDEYLANYLNDLRTNRQSRPVGSRPYPSKPPPSMLNRERDFSPRASSTISSYSTSGFRPTGYEGSIRSASNLTQHHRRPGSSASMSSSAGRPLVQDPQTMPYRRFVTPSHIRTMSSVPPSTTYQENLYRQKERQEARSLRDALEEMDLQDEQRIYNSAQDEATELVFKHQHPGVPLRSARSEFRNPDLGSVSSRYSSRYGPGGRMNKANSVYGEGIPSQRQPASMRSRQRVNFVLPPEEEPTLRPKPKNEDQVTPRNVSNDSSKGIFRNPNDQIYEEPQASPPEAEEKPPFARSYPSALKSKPKNSNSLPRGFWPPPSSQFDDFPPPPLLAKDKLLLSRFEIHRNPPSQSRDPAYTTNGPISKPTTIDTGNVPTKDGIEIRSDDIRAATSKKKGDRSTNLPMPTGVSQRPGRPIVSFDRTWEPAGAKPPLSKDMDTVAAPKAIPTIQLPPEDPPTPPPVINISPSREPTISEMMTSHSAPRDEQAQNKARPAKSQSKWSTPYTRAGVPTATCAACSMAISGKIVTAAGLRLHPECFSCHHCHTQLECIAFYQEPTAKREERLAEAEDKDEEAKSLRFYCHLDFHELFSPRCKSCKTPIEGEVVVACGAEWHAGHFFCAECGDVCSPSPGRKREKTPKLNTELNTQINNFNSPLIPKNHSWKKMALHGVLAAIQEEPHHDVSDAENQ